jgi:sarcosine oxidase
MRIAVIGAGLIGAAAARHLAMAGHEVVLIGPPEPEQKAGHRGVFGSHYDAGRITRSLDPWAFWSRASRESIARYAQIEDQGGVRFFHETGLVMAGPDRSGPISAVAAGAARDGIACDRLHGPALAARFPYFRFKNGTLAMFEPKGAGYINPRSMVRAQIVAAQRFGAEWLRVVAQGMRDRAGGVVIDTDAGEVAADQALISAGGYSEGLCPVPLNLTVYARTVVLLEVDAQEAARLTGMPPLIWLEPEGNDPYLLPPIRYPDGRTYLKMGGDVVDVVLRDAQDIGAWFQSGGNADVGRMLADQVRARMPGVRVLSTHVQPCVTTFAPDNTAVLRRVGPHISVATAGNGRGAKCSDELGRLGAEVALGRDLPEWALQKAI